MRQDTRRGRSVARVQTLMACTRGANMVEYIMLVGLVALVCISSFKYFSDTIRVKVIEQTGTIRNIGR